LRTIHTQLVTAWSAGDRHALHEPTPKVYVELRRLADRYMRKERAGNTLQASALVNEVFMRLVDVEKVSWQDRARFFAVSANMMRRILVDRARAKKMAKRGAGAVHINLNLGCPYGRMTSGLTGGGMLQRPELLEEIFFALRAAITGSFSVKLRAGYDDPLQIFGLLPLFEKAGVDFLVLHPRTVAQEYQGLADHAITSRVVQQTRLPVIANGDIRTAADGLRLLEESGAAGLMLGRGAIADPLLFERLRGRAPAEPARPERAAMLRRYLQELLSRYGELFCGETQVLNKVKGVLATFDDADFEQAVRQLRKARTMPAFCARLAELE